MDNARSHTHGHQDEERRTILRVADDGWIRSVGEAELNVTYDLVCDMTNRSRARDSFTGRVRTELMAATRATAAAKSAF